MNNQYTERAFNPSFWPWGADADSARVLHTMVRVLDLERSLSFYCEALGMKVLDRYDFQDGRFSIIFLSFGSYDAGAAIELTWNWDREDHYSHGAGYGHVAIGVPDIEAAVKRIEVRGFSVVAQPKAMAEGAPRLAFVNDPDGYSIELIETRRSR